MPLTNPFSAKNCFSLFEIRLDTDFVVFRGGEDESAGQLLRGVVVLCLSAPLRVEEVRLRLSGNLRLVWAESKPSHADAASQRVDRTMSILEHRWPAFVGGPSARTKTTVLPEGNYEWPFEFTLPGNTAESVEGIPEASISYRLKATIARGKLSHDLHAHRHLRVIRTLEPGALELLHAMSVENTWPNKVDYSIVVPQKAVVFGASVTLAMRFTPLLKGLELGRVVARLVEVRDCAAASPTGGSPRQHRAEREVTAWKFDVCRDHWRDAIDETGQDGWVLTKKLPLPGKLRQCVQDLSHHGIKVRHKLKLAIALKNPDGHVSELRAMLPISIFISPDMAPDEEGNLAGQAASGGRPEIGLDAVCPPGYGAHVLDPLYDDADLLVPVSPARSRTVSHEDLPRIDIVDDVGVATPPPGTPSGTPSGTTPSGTSSGTPSAATTPSVPSFAHLSPPPDGRRASYSQRIAAAAAAAVSSSGGNTDGGTNSNPPSSSAPKTSPKPSISRSGSLLSRSGSRLARSRSRLSRGGSRDLPSPTSATGWGGSAAEQQTEAPAVAVAVSVSGASRTALAALSDLNKVPSYATAVKTPPNWSRTRSGGVALPNYYQAAFGGAVSSGSGSGSGRTDGGNGGGNGCRNNGGPASGRRSLDEGRLPQSSQSLRVPRTSRPRPTSVTSVLVHGLHPGDNGGDDSGDVGGEDGTEQGRGWHGLSHVRERIF